MKKLIAALALLLCLSLSLRAQVIILNDSMFRGRMSEIKATVLDSLTNEPVSFASVYVIPSKDTTITNFTLTDAKGEAKLDEVPYGSYVFHVEMMGYKPFVKEKYFREEKEDMGTIRLQVDEQFLQAATITDVGNPIVIKQDTVEFNASSFRVGANAMLKDLLLRMPGMEITEDGKVKFNGEEIDKLTVGGRTFFFNDQSTALNNLPASVVDKIRVIDRESEGTRASGLQDGGREKVLDVALKKEYEKGWFGNATLKGGATLANKDDDNPLRDNRGLLWSANALVSAYSEKDQVTVIANGQNIDDSGLVFMTRTEEGETTMLQQGLSTAGQLGVNVNSSRIKDVESTASVNYKYTDTDSGSQTRRTTFQDDGDLASTSQDGGKQYVNSLSANLEFQKESGKVWFHVRPSFRYSKTDQTATGTSETLREGAFVNRSEKVSRNLSADKDADLDADLSFRELGGKKGRTIRLMLESNYGDKGGESDESSLLTTGDGSGSRTMHYRSDGRDYTVGAYLRYTEPFGEKWTLSAMGGLENSRSDKARDAFDAAGKNDFYSSVSRNLFLEQQYDMTIQYKFGERNWITLGGRLLGIYNETYTKSFGIETTVGQGEWDWRLSPTARFQFNKGNDEFSGYMSGYGMRPGASRMQPVLNIADPARLSLGNVYLRPYSQTYFNMDWTRDNPEKFTSFMIYLFGNVNAAPVSYARWYDSDGVLYSIPVNARKPAVNATFSVSYMTPLDARKNWTLSLVSYALFASNVNYQAKTALPGLDKEHFDYSAFMADFWGDAAGDRFYGGLSGFQESRTHTVNPYASVSLKFNQDQFSLAARASVDGHIARYSLDPTLNMNTLDTRLGFQGTYTAPHEWEFDTDLSYVFYKGYSAGYGQPEWQWNAEISKNIGAFNLSVKVNDILNQTRNLTHTITANYTEDTYRLVMGRYLLFGVRWNFGKMNAAHSARAQQAMWDMAW